MLYLPPYTTHILQPLDLKLFALLQVAYQKGVKAKSWFQGFYKVDKVEFLEILQDAYDEAFTTKNILSGWQVVGLSPFNLEMVMKTLPSTNIEPPRPKTPLVTFTANGESVEVQVTPTNSMEVRALFEKILRSNVDLEVVEKESLKGDFATFICLL